METKKPKNEDAFSEMEQLLSRSLKPGARLFEYIESELIEEKGKENGGKPDPKPLKEVVSVLQQIKELRECESANELMVIFSDERGKDWSE